MVGESLLEVVISPSVSHSEIEDCIMILVCRVGQKVISISIKWEFVRYIHRGLTPAKVGPGWHGFCKNLKAKTEFSVVFDVRCLRSTSQQALGDSQRSD
jgi:hypothetical protein